MPTTPTEAAHAAAPRRFPLLRGVLRIYRALVLTVLTGLVGAILLVPLLRTPADYLAGLRAELALAQGLAAQAPTQVAAASAILVALFALSWLSDHISQRAN
jgi:hypothetical protein